MSKRKRLNPFPFGEPLAEAALETKAMYPMGVAPQMPRRAPIADVAGSAAALAALQEVTQSMTRAQQEGRMVLTLPLAAIDLDYLVRDRIAPSDDDDDMAALMASLRARGQQTPIEVCDLGDGRYGLISGWRRCQALRHLQDQIGDAAFGTVLALLRHPDQSSDAYLAMVEENEIRLGLSYYERARIVAKSVDHGVFDTEKTALQRLFHTASRAKRSKIGSFLGIVRALDGALRFAPALGERAGLKLSKALGDDPNLAPRLCVALQQAAPNSAADELAVLERASSGEKPTSTATTCMKKARFIPRDGVQVDINGDGRMVISGAALNDELRDRLLAFLGDEP